MIYKGDIYKGTINNVKVTIRPAFYRGKFDANGTKRWMIYIDSPNGDKLQCFPQPYESLTENKILVRIDEYLSNLGFKKD